MDEHRRFKIGDKVRVLFINEYAKNIEPMRLSVGKISTVIKVNRYNSCVLQLNNQFWYCQNCLELILDNYSEISERLAVL